MSSTTYDRRAFMAYFGSIGLGTTLLPGVLWAQAAQQQGATITTEQIAAAEEVAGLQFSEEERKAMAEGLGRARNDLSTLHKEAIDMSMFPTIVFDPVPAGKELPNKAKKPAVRSKIPVMAR